MDLEQLDTLLKQRFQNAQTELEYVTPGERIGGYLIWEGFQGVEQIERQRQLGNVIRTLPPSQQLEITTILTVTPSELTVMRED